MSLDSSATLIALVSVPLLIVASFIVDLAVGHRYAQRIGRWSSGDRNRAESARYHRVPAGHREGRIRRCPTRDTRTGSPRSGTVRLSDRGRACRVHQGH